MHVQIISSSDQAILYEGCPVFIDTYLKPGYLEFREIESYKPIEWAVGDYIFYERTLRRYELRQIPQRAKQAKADMNGASFVYENVQFFDASKDLEMPFIDLVPSDNLIHFSTLNTVAFTGTPENVAERIQACLNYWLPDRGWSVSIVGDLSESSDAALIETLATEADFNVAGATCQEALGRMYDIWGLGWSVTSNSDNTINHIVIGAPNKRTDNNTTVPYAYGDGIVRIKTSAGNLEEIGTRLYVYGSTTNLPGDYYRNQNIKDAESVDIEHLMIPISSWGVTDGLPDARKAYLENATAEGVFGLIPKYAYFDGTDSNYPEIYPTIEGATIGDVRAGLNEIGDLTYYPSTTVYTNPAQRVDEILSADNPTDHGLQAPSGKKYALELNGDVAEYTMIAPTRSRGRVIRVYEYTTLQSDVTFDGMGDFFAFATITGSITETQEEVASHTITAVIVSLIVSVTDSDGNVTENRVDYELPTEGGLVALDENDNLTFTIPSSAYVRSGQTVASVAVKASVHVEVPYETSVTVQFNEGKVSLGAYYVLPDTFVVTIPQVGFNPSLQASLGNGISISMKSGMCAGRDFMVDSCVYNSDSDNWELTCIRAKDDDLGIVFPNTDFPIASGDKYVFLDIAMPELYIAMAQDRLLEAGTNLLADIDHEKYFYEPDIDAKVVYNEGRVLRAGWYMHLVTDVDPDDPDINHYDENIIENDDDYVIIDSVEIDENGSNIPTYIVKLRKKKPVEWTESISSGSVTKSSSSVSSNEPVVSSSSNSSGDSYWELRTMDDGSQYVWLKDIYAGAAAGGFISAGGLSTTSGGAGATALSQLTDVSLGTLSDGQALVWDASLNDGQGAWTNGAGGGGSGVTSLYSLTEVLPSTSPSGGDLFYFNGAKWTNISRSDYLYGYALTEDIPTKLSDLTDDILSGYYQPLDPDLTALAALSGSGYPYRSSNGTWTLKTGDFFELAPDGHSVKLKDDYTGLWAEGWISAGGISGTSGGGGGATELDDLTDVTVSGEAGGDVLYYNGVTWTNTPLASLTSGYATLSDLGSYQPLDSDLTAIAALSGNGYLKHTASGWSFVDLKEFFELASDGHSVKLKDDYDGLWAEGWISAGGLSNTQSGSGGATELNDLTDVETSAVSGGDVLYYNGTTWTNTALASVLSGYATLTDLGGYQPLDSDLTAIAALTGNGFLCRTANGWGMVTIQEFFELASDGHSVKLKDEYDGLWAEGWISAGGVSNTASGGGASALNDLSDVTIASVAADDILIYSNGEWQNTPKSTFLDGYATTNSLGSYALSSSLLQTITVGDTVYNVSGTNVTIPAIGSSTLTLKVGGNYSLTTYTYDGLDDVTVTVSPARLGISSWATASSKPTYKTSELTNDSGFITSASLPTNVSDLTNDSGFITSSDLPTKISDLTNDLAYLTIKNGSTTIIKYRGSASKTLDLATYLPSKTSDLTNDSGFITSSSLPTKTSDLTNDSGYITSSAIPTNISSFTNDAGYALSSEIPTKVSELTNDSGYITGYTETDPTVPSWAKDSSLAFASLPAMYIGKNAVQSSSAIQSLTGIGNITPGANGSYDLGTSSMRWDELHINKIYLGAGTPYMYWDSTNSCWHVTGDFVADGFVSAGGVSTTS